MIQCPDSKDRRGKEIKFFKALEDSKKKLWILNVVATHIRGMGLAKRDMRINKKVKICL